MLSFGYYGSDYYSSDARQEFVRFENTSNLFYDDSLDSDIQVKWNEESLVFHYDGGNFQGRLSFGDREETVLGGDHARIWSTRSGQGQLAPFKLYRFEVHERFERRESDYLLPPSGENLVSLLLTHKEIRSLANDLFSSIGLRLGLRPQEHKIEILKQYEDIIVSYPYRLTSDTLQRLVFYMAAILSNKDSVLVFEEPESHAFPYYTKYLAELMALDQAQNQYFISTHNPYFLLPLLEKTPKDEIAIFITYFEDYETKVRPLNDDQLQRLTEIDVFSNLDSFLED